MTLKTFEEHGIRQLPEYSPLQVKRILVAVDFSPASRNAFGHALTLARYFQSELMVLYVVPPAPIRAFAEIEGVPPCLETDLSSGEKNLRTLTASARTQGIKNTKASVRIGVPSHEIVEAAKDGNFDLIVIATHGYTGWKHFCIGSTAERVVRAAPCPVLVVREKEHEFY
jgi:universal stress protein A